MITKTVTIDENKMYDELYAKLEPSYTLVWLDYRDELSPKQIQNCLDARSTEPLETEGVFDDSRRYYAKEILENLLSKTKYSDDEKELFRTTDQYDELRIEIESRDDSTPEKDIFVKSCQQAYIRFHSNYDCWLPLYEQGGICSNGTALVGIMAALSLNPMKVKQAAVRKGITVSGTFRNIKGRDGKELVDYDAFIRVLCETPNYGNWSFFGKLDGQELSDASFDIDSMTIPKGTTAAMFNWWNGGGSLDFCETLRPVTVKELRRRMAPYLDDLKLVVDDRSCRDHGYTPNEVYGGTVSGDILLTA